MSSKLRRFEVLLPLRSNDGSGIPEALGIQTIEELRERFGAVSAETQVIRGTWQESGETYRDEPVRVFVDAPDLPEHRAFFVAFKETLKERFGQLDI